MKNNMAAGLFILLMIVTFSPSLKGQSVTDFSGEWIQDNSRSDAYYKDHNIRVTITQSPEKIAIKTTFIDKNGRESSARESFNLDGKEVKKEEYGGVNATSASWSADGKILTTKTTRTVKSEVYGSTTSYSLSDDGHTLTILTVDINPGQPSLKQVLEKKE